MRFHGVVTDGDSVFQPRKFERSGLADAVGGDVLIYVHKEQAIDPDSAGFKADVTIDGVDDLLLCDLGNIGNAGADYIGKGRSK